MSLFFQLNLYSAEDFVVTEIGCGGVLASVNDRSIPPLPDRSQLVSNAKRRRISESNHPVCDVDPIREPSVFEGEDEQSHKEPVLEALVGKDIASRLERFSTSYRDAKKAEGQILNLGTCNAHSMQYTCHCMSQF